MTAERVRAHDAASDAALATVPPEVRRRALTAALSAFEDVLTRAGLHLDLFERFELLEECLDAAYERLSPQLN